jgi:hypothetical protein
VAFEDVHQDMAAADGGDLVEQTAKVNAGQGDEVVLTLAGRYTARDGYEIPVTLTKGIRLTVDGLVVRRTLRNDGPTSLTCRFGCEWNVALYDGEVFLEGGDGALDASDLPPSNRVAVRVPLHQARLTWEHDKPVTTWVHPVRTATQGEDGFHLTYQGHMMLFSHDINLAPGEETTLTQTVTLAHGVHE